MAIAAAIAACAHAGDGESDRFVRVPMLVDSGAPGVDGSIADGGSDSAADAASSALEPTPPSSVGCQTVVTCRAQAATKDEHAPSAEFARCAPTAGVDGSFSARETREARSSGSALCCYVTFENCI